MSGASCSRSSMLEYLNRNAPPVNAELPPRACAGAVSIIATEAPAACADRAALAAALPAPTTRTSTAPSCAGVISRLLDRHDAWPADLSGPGIAASVPAMEASVTAQTQTT